MISVQHLRDEVKSIKWKLGMILFALMLMVGCAPAAVTPTDTSPTSKPLLSTQSPTGLPAREYDLQQFTTPNDLTGNRFVNGSMDLHNASAIDIPVDGKPVWLVSAPVNDGVVFVVVMENGQAQAFKITKQTHEPFDITPSQLPAGMPPLLAMKNNTTELITPPAEASPFTNPILVGDQLAYIALNGDLVLNQTRLPINALLDARILMDEQDRLLILTQPTDRYAHGVLGDTLEASAIAIIETTPELRVVETITINKPDVIEGISPIWADVDNDGKRDIIVTLSNSDGGARIVAYSEDGVILAETPPIGRGNRWRHQLAIAQFEADKPPLLVSVRTPHIGGIVEFFQFNNDRFESVMEIKGFSTHSIGSRNLDFALVGDFNNDGIVELIAPDQSHTSLGVISIDGILFTLPLGGTLTSNLTAALLNGVLYLAAGTDGSLRVWIPNH